MSISAGTYKDLIIAELQDEGTFLADNIDLYWSMFSAKATTYVQYLYTKRHAILALMGQVRKRVDFAARGGDANISDSDLMDHLVAMLKAVQASIDEMELAGTDIVVDSGTGGGWTLTPGRA
jgi:hypothetical protein